MAIKLYRCSNLWVKIGAHPCWRVQKALDEQGIEYEVVKGPQFGKREEIVRVSGQRKYPVIQFEDGSVYREESKDMAATIRAGRLDEKRASGSVAAEAAPAGPESGSAGAESGSAGPTAG